MDRKTVIQTLSVRKPDSRPGFEAETTNAHRAQRKKRDGKEKKKKNEKGIKASP
jgi:hypothetical protein